MAKIHIWGGGPYHPTHAQANWIAQQVAPHTVSYGNTREMFDPERLSEADLLVMMGMDNSSVVKIPPEKWVEPAPRPERYEPLSDRHFQAIQEHLKQGKPLFCHHIAIGSFDERTEFGNIFDGRWIIGRSTHPPIHDFKVTVRLVSHPILAGIEDFIIRDELYHHLDYPNHSEILLEAEYEGQRWPLAWAGNYGKAKVAYSALGHNMPAYANPSLQRLILNTIGWLLHE